LWKRFERTRPALRLVVSRSRPPEFVQRLAGQLGAELVPLGSAGAKAAAVITGEVDAYVHSGGQYEWDSAAPVAVARAAGLHTSRIDGSNLSYNSEQPDTGYLIIPSRLLHFARRDQVGAAE
jgi:3'(2'), 5'-bisphosphate nucleotidase